MLAKEYCGGPVDDAVSGRDWTLGMFDGKETRLRREARCSTHDKTCDREVSSNGGDGILGNTQERGRSTRGTKKTRRTSSGGSGGLGGRSTRPGSENTDKAQVRTRGAEDGGRRSWANARGRLVDPMNEERDNRRSSGSSGSPEAQVRCPEHGARSPRLGSQKTESGRQDARGREGRERMYYAKAIVSGTSLYGSRPHPGGWVYGGSGGPGRTSGAEERKGSDVVTVARSGE
ncbi:hypothetical protein K438DRAFT_1942992 [Mycena galopus ATCC 62051]|nr:hypothetical protein K438DRAFT_1942992 [Mycena galopus ATCC 62051]